MKVFKRAVLILLAVLVVGLTGVAVWQRNNISALIKSATSTDEELANKLNESKQNLETDLKEKYPSIVSDFTAEEERLIMKGELSLDAAVEKLNNEYSAVRGNNSAKADTKTDKKPNAEVDEKADELIGDKVIELYSLKAYYLGQLGQLEATVRREYSALPESKRNLIGKKELAARHIGTANGLLSQCDAKVSELLSSLQSDLRALGADTSIIKTIRDAYENEKALKKAYYLKMMD